MKNRRWIWILSIALCGAGWIAPGILHADSAASDGYTIDDLKLDSAGELVDVCTIGSGHQHHDVALGFCYGFFEGATHYDDAISSNEHHIDLVCSPADTTRQQAVAVFLDYMEKNPQYNAERPIDTIFRAMIAKWPCSS
jgi:hypothetical protein